MGGMRTVHTSGGDGDGVGANEAAEGGNDDDDDDEDVDDDVDDDDDDVDDDDNIDDDGDDVDDDVDDDDDDDDVDDDVDDDDDDDLPSVRTLVRSKVKNTSVVRTDILPIHTTQSNNSSDPSPAWQWIDYEHVLSVALERTAATTEGKRHLPT